MDCVTSHEVDRRYLFKSPVFEVETGSVGYSRIGGARSKGNKRSTVTVKLIGSNN